jgi:hypothetical protein
MVKILDEIENKKLLFVFYENLSKEQKIFIYCYSFKQMKFKDIEEVLKKFDTAKNYEDVRRLDSECKQYTIQIQNIRNKFHGDRKEDNDFESFFEWYKKQKSHCGYCGITQIELHSLFTYDDNAILPLNDNWSKNDKGTLQIERKDSKDNSYHVSNLILACPLCNNAKSNLIDEVSWRDFFVGAMIKYYEKLLVEKLINDKLLEKVQ